MRHQFKTVYLSEMMDELGRFPAELKRTKPYGYSLFVIDAMAGVAQIASSETEDLWTFSTENGRSMAKGMAFIYPSPSTRGAGLCNRTSCTGRTGPSVIPVFCFRESDLASLTIWMHGKALRRILALMKSCVTCRSVTLCSGFRPPDLSPIISVMNRKRIYSCLLRPRVITTKICLLFTLP